MLAIAVARHLPETGGAAKLKAATSPPGWDVRRKAPPLIASRGRISEPLVSCGAYPAHARASRVSPLHAGDVRRQAPLKCKPGAHYAPGCDVREP